MSREMEHSGIPWVGEIPKDWEMYRIKYNTFLKGRIGWQGLNSNDFIDEGYCLITGTDFDNKGGINWHTCYRISKERFYEDELLHIKNGDLLMTKDGTVGKMAYIKNLPEEASLNSHLLIIRQTTERIENEFLYWIMLSDVFKRFCSIYQSGSIMNSISQSTLGLFCSYCPSITEQRKIASFLNRKCAEIDEMITLQEKIVEELKAYKQSVITEAVTKGLNPDVPMKDSGIEWIGEIPEHWEVSKVSRYFQIQLGKMLQPNQESETDTLCNYLCAANVGKNVLKLEPLKQMWISEKEKEQFSVKKGDLLVVEGGDVASCDVITDEVSDLYFQNALHRVRAKSNQDVRYLKYLLMIAKHNGHIDLICNKATISHFTKEKFATLNYLLPTVEEQNDIVSYLDTQCTEIDYLISIKLSKIDSLKEYKKSIIYEYVTGKKEVTE